MYFSISAPQQVTIPTPDGPLTLSFRVNAQNSALCEIHIVGADDKDVTGTHILTFNRNGAAADTTFVPTEAPKSAEAAPLAGYKSVDDDAVRTDNMQASAQSQVDKDAKNPTATPAYTPPAPAPTPAAKPVDSKPAP